MKTYNSEIIKLTKTPSTYKLLGFVIIAMISQPLMALTVRDNFDVISYANNDGTNNWNTDWLEVDSAGAGPATGAIQVIASELRLQDGIAGTPSLTREVNLNAALTAVLTFDWRVENPIDPADAITLEIRNDGGFFNEIFTYTGLNLAQTNTDSFDLKNITGVDYTGSNTQIRFRISANYEAVDEFFYVNNFQILYTLAPGVNGKVFKELNNNGLKELNETGVQNVTVVAYDIAGVAVATTNTDATGNYFFPTLVDGQQYRLEFTNLPNGFKPALQGTSSKTSVAFVTAPKFVDFGIGSPTLYCQANPDLVTSFYRPPNIGRFGDPAPPAPVYPTTQSALVSFPYDSTGSAPPATIEATYNDLGTTYGLAYQSESNLLFASAFLKRHAKFGPGGAGAGDVTGSIYKITNPGDGVVSTITEFLNLNDIIGSNVTGIDTHATNASLLEDGLTYPLVGKRSFGDMDISEDSKDLWVVNLANRNLYKLPLGPDPTNPTVPTLVQITAIDMLLSANYVPGSAPNCTGGNAINFRPFAVKHHNGKVFVGAVCSAESTGLVADLDAHVYTYDETSALFTQVLSFPLNFNRGCGLELSPDCAPVSAMVNTANWNPWVKDLTDYRPAGMTIPNPFDAIEVAYPQPILADIEFTNDDQLVMGFRDRWGDQMGHNQVEPDGSGTLIRGQGYGDIIRAITTNAGISWTFNPVDATQGTEFFDQDSWTDGFATHFETSFGGLASLPINGTITMTNMDPLNNGGTFSDYAGGIRSYLLPNGGNDHSFQIYTDTTSDVFFPGYLPRDGGSEFYGKANGLGDLEALCDTPSVEIGNRVWLDVDGNGVQDAGEPGISGVVVNLIDTDGITIIGTVTTDAIGEFYFTNAAGVDILGKDFAVIMSSNVNNYTFRIDTTQVTLVGRELTALGGTGASSASNDIHDSDASLTGINAEIIVATGASGHSNHSFDFGFIITGSADLSLVKNVSNSTPFIGNQVTFTVAVTNDGPSDATNITVVDVVPNGFSAITSISNSGVLAGNTITWSGLNLTNGSSVNLTFDVTVEAIGDYNNLAQITAADQIDADSTPNNGVDTDGDGNTDDDQGDEDDGDGEPVFPVVPGTCVLGNNDVGGIVFRDFNQNGTQDVLEPGFGVTGMIVTAYNAANVAVATATVGSDGKYVFPGLAGASYRLEFSGLPSYLQHGAAGAQTISSVRFINAASCSADYSLNNPVDYCQVNPNFIMARMTKNSILGAVPPFTDNSGISTILQYNYLDNGVTAPTNIQTYANLGTIYGLAHLRKANVTYASTYFKRHADVGPTDQVGSIYKIDHNAANATSTFTTLAGANPRGVGPAGTGYDWDHDTVSYVNVGKVGIGDIELSDDESQLFAVNMSDRNLYIMGVDSLGDLSGTSNVAIPNPCANVIDYRPMGLGFNDGVLYVGVTCTAESSVDPNNADMSYNGPRKGNKALLSAHVYSFDPIALTFSATPVLDVPLNYGRGCGFEGNISATHPPGCQTITAQDATLHPFIADWNPWQMDYDIVFNDKPPGNIGNQENFLEYMQPILSDIEFDNDGSLVIQIKDINGDRTGHLNSSPNPLDNPIAGTNPNGGLYVAANGNSYGDLLRACGNPVDGWTLETNGSCGGITTGGAGINEGPGGGEYYYYDNGPGANGSVNGFTFGHSETTMGGLLLIPGHIDVITGIMDPNTSVSTAFDNGLMWLQNTGVSAGQISLDGGGIPKRLQVSQDLGASFFGKASGIGDIEALCDPAPVEIGNRIWNDTDGDGIQDANEPGIDGVTVTLTCGIDSVSAVTANGGQYYFSNAAIVNAGTTQALFMDSGENCQLSIDSTQVAINTLYNLTLQDADGDVSNDSTTDVRDSDANQVGLDFIINLTVEASGHNNHSYDFGLEPSGIMFDRGDAPDTGAGTGAGNYNTLLSDNGPSQVINNNLYLGAGPADNDIDGQPNANATGDDLSGSGDEDGPISALNFATGDIPAIQILVTNQSGVAANLAGWIDYNGNGVFDVGENATVAVPNGTMAAVLTLTFPVVPTTPITSTILRLRLTTAPGVILPTGASPFIGEIEDHRVILNNNTDLALCYDVADAVDDFLLTVDPYSGAVAANTAFGLGSNAPFLNIESMAWDFGNPLIAGDEVLYAFNDATLVQLLPAPRAIKTTLSNATIQNVNGFAIDWQSTPPVFYGSGNTIVAQGPQAKLFTFNANGLVSNLSPADIVLTNNDTPISTNTHIDDLTWDPFNRRLLGVTSSGVLTVGVNNNHIVEFDMSNFPASVTVNDCGHIVLPGPIPRTDVSDVEGMTMSSTGDIYLTTGIDGVATFDDSMFRIPLSSINTDCSTIAVGASPDLIVERVGVVNNLNQILSTNGTPANDHEAVDCSLSFTDSLATIGNRVWLDEDSDGQQDAGEDGIGGVKVYLCRSNAVPCNAGSAILSDITDANGGYLFPNLPIMDYIVAVDTATVPTNLVANPTYDEDSGTISPNHTTAVSLNQVEEEHLTADFGYNWNNPPETGTPPPGTVGSIGDRIWIDANANGVQDGTESGLNGVTVNLFTDPDGDGVYDNLVATTTTSANGNYVFDGLVAGAYVVEVDTTTLPAGVLWSQTGDPDEFAQIASAPDNKTTDPVILAPGDVFVNADFGYQGNVGSVHSIGDTIYLDANANGVLDGSETGIANVTVTLLDASGNPLAFTTTDVNGLYLFSGLPDGTYSVYVNDTNNVLASLKQTADPDAILDSKSTVVLAGADNLLQDFGYTPKRHTAALGLIGDTIFMDINGDGIQTVNEPGIEGVTVELIASNGLPFARTVTDENGRYYFGNLPADTYSVLVDTTTLPNAGVGLANTADPDGGADSTSAGVVIAVNVNLLQDFGYQVTVPNTLGGTLWNDKNADGTQAGIETTVFAGVTINLLDVNGNLVGTTVTDVTGSYQFTGLPDGTYTVVVTDNSNKLAGHWLTQGTSPGLNLNSQVVGYTISLAGGANNQTGDFGYYVDLARVGDIVFRDDNDNGMRDVGTEPGIPLVPVTLTITYPNGDVSTLTTLTDGAGFYSFEKLLADDSYTGDVIASGLPQPTYSITIGSVATGYMSTFDGTADFTGIGNGTNNNSDNTLGEAAFPLKGSQDLTNDFGFVPGATIGNRVWLDLDNDGIQDANEDGISNRTITLTPPIGVDVGAGPGVAITTVTDTNGNYIFTNLPLANGYTVTVSNPPVGYTQTFDEDDNPNDIIPDVGSPHSSIVNLTVANEEHLTADFGYRPADGTIGDYIWSDVNADGQQDPFEIGIADVDVYLCVINTVPCDATTVIAFPAKVLAMTTTDATGHYLFTGLDLTIGHVVGVDTPTLPTDYMLTGDPDNVSDNQTTVLPLNTSGNINLDADFGYQPLGGGGAANHFNIGDTVYQDVNGNAVQNLPTDTGIAGVTIQLFVDTTGNSIPDTAIASDITDASGNYLFPTLPDMKAYSVVVSDTQNILNNFKQTADPDIILDNKSTIPNLIADNLLQDFGYRPIRNGVGAIGDRIFHDVNANGIDDLGDQGLEGVTVRLFDANGNLINSIKTDENGAYLFTGLTQDATYSVEVVTTTLPNGGAGWTNNIDPDLGPPDILPNSMSTVDLSLSPTGINLNQDFGYTGGLNTISGTVWKDDDGNGLLTDGTGPEPSELLNGIANVTIHLLSTTRNIVATTVTAADGSFLFTGLPDGTYIVCVVDATNELANLIHTDGPMAGNNLIDNNSQDDTGYAVAVAGGITNSTADFGYRPVVTTPITLGGFKVSYDKNTGINYIRWSTLIETGNIGFEIYQIVDGTWVKVNAEIIPSKHVYHSGLTKYEYQFSGPFRKEWAIVDIDIMGKRQSHGIFKVDELFGLEDEIIAPVQWDLFNQEHDEKESQRNIKKANDINNFINVNKRNVLKGDGEGS